MKFERSSKNSVLRKTSKPPWDRLVVRENRSPNGIRMEYRQTYDHDKKNISTHMRNMISLLKTVILEKNPKMSRPTIDYKITSLPGFSRSLFALNISSSSRTRWFAPSISPLNRNKSAASCMRGSCARTPLNSASATISRARE